MRVRGIDPRGNSRVMLVDGLTARRLAELLCRSRWRYAVLDDDGRVVGGVTFSAGARKRTWWAAGGNRGGEP